MDDDIRSRFRRPTGGQTPARPLNNLPPQRPPQRPQSPPVAVPRPRPQPAPPQQPQPQQPVAAAPHVKKKRKKRGILPVIVFLVLSGLAAGAGYMGYNKYYKKTPVANVNNSAGSETSEPQLTGTIRFIATGDSLAYDSINNAAKKEDGSYDYLPMMSEFKPFYDKADIGLCNETTPGGGDKNGLAISGYPNFNAPTDWSVGFAELGCNIINLASERTNDKGQPAIDAMVETWSLQKDILAVAGANRTPEEQAKVRYFEVKGLKFAYLAYTTNVAARPVSPHGVNLYSDDLAGKQVTEARKNADFVVVSMNWGTENSADINADQERIAQFLADKNVDVIVGGGPRVLQPAKVLNGSGGHQTMVWFSLGNFLGSPLPLENLIGGMAIMDIDVATQQIQNPKLLPVYMHYEWTPQQKAAGTINARHDFKLYPLDQAAVPLGRSLNNTTVEAQTQRVTGIITKFVPIQVIKSGDF